MGWDFITWPGRDTCIAVLFTANASLGVGDLQDVIRALEKHLGPLERGYDFAAKKALRLGSVEVYDWCLLAVFQQPISDEQARETILQCNDRFGDDTLLGTGLIARYPLTQTDIDVLRHEVLLFETSTWGKESVNTFDGVLGKLAEKIT